MENASASEKIKLQFDESSLVFLKDAAKWAHVLSIIGFISIGYMGVFAIGILFSQLSTTVIQYGGDMVNVGMALAFLIISIIYFFTVYFLNRFAVNTKKALKENNTFALTNSFKNLKFLFKYIGIVIIGSVVLYMSSAVILVLIGTI
ncbi:hypothetical protein [Flavobacterium sp. SORGH_AS_0622]|uniref:hypothetical protein n=1 Tax=Flavobacterium sp. SORGH_AS_0622 TaxID=3041772 RepID=UPI00277E934D|nr:hypothetical protein [Flavobacterium sp. SORGH_AS_0622]MDQ1167446.1 hypothetical protein [Flavobacterium sp. SORGH_AS_0622]